MLFLYILGPLSAMAVWAAINAVFLRSSAYWAAKIHIRFWRAFLIALLIVIFKKGFPIIWIYFFKVGYLFYILFLITNLVFTFLFSTLLVLALIKDVNGNRINLRKGVLTAFIFTILTIIVKVIFGGLICFFI